MSVNFQAAFLAKEQMYQQVMKRQEKLDNQLAEDNLNRVVRLYTQAINGAETSQEAQGHAAALESLLQSYGKTMNDIQGINNPLLNNNPKAAQKAGGTKGTEQDKKVIADLSAEFGIDVKKSGTTKDWLEKAKTDDKVRILDKSGKDVTDATQGRIKQGDILEIKSEKYGLVKIQVGGDGEINGNDDKVIAMGGKAAADGLFTGLNQINNPAAQQQVANLAGLVQPNAILENAEVGIANQKTLFNEDEIKNLVAAILHNAIAGTEAA